VYLPSALHVEQIPSADHAASARHDLAASFAAAGVLGLAESVSPELAVAKLTGKKVLVVDDDFRNIFALTVLLERSGLEVVSAESGEEAIATLERTPDVDLVLMDVMMPVMDGYAAMRAIRKLPWRGPLGIIAMTAKTGAGERERCLQAGATGYIAKPIENGPDFLVEMSNCLIVAESVDSDVLV
jgi:CheY-like chemotaxis protein